MKKEPVIAWIGAWLMRLLGATLHIENRDLAGYFGRKSPEPVIGIFWHNRIFATPLCFLRYKTLRPLTVLTSASRDGGLLAVFVKRFGISAVRGSSSRRGATALRELAAELQRGSDVVITPDGPRGPRYVLGPGAILLSQITGAPIMPVHVEYSNYWELKSWDRFRIPKPFSRVIVTFVSLETIGETADEAAFEAERQRIETLLRTENDSATKPGHFSRS